MGAQLCRSRTGGVVAGNAGTGTAGVIGTVGNASFGTSGQNVLRRRPQCGHLWWRAGYWTPQFGQITVSGEIE